MASGFTVSEQSASAQGTGYAGAGVLSQDSSSQWFNPATLAGLDKTEFTAAVQQISIDTSFKSDGASGAGDFKDLSLVVGSLFMAVPVSERVTLGLGMNAPFGAKLEYEENWGNMAVDPLAPLVPTTGDRYSTMSDLKTLNVNPALALKVTDRLNVGLGISYQKVEADVENAFSRLVGEDDAYGWNAGVTFAADDNNHFGLAYRSAVDYKLDGDMTFNQAGSFALMVPAGKYAGSADLTLPASATFSYAGTLTETTRILLGAEWTGWSSLDQLDVETSIGTITQGFDWDNTLRYSAGVMHAVSKNTLLRAGAYKEESTQGTNNRSAISPDSDRIGVSIGAGFKPVENMTIDVVYTHLFVEDADAKLTERGALQGTFELDADVIGAQINYRL